MKVWGRGAVLVENQGRCQICHFFNFFEMKNPKKAFSTNISPRKHFFETRGGGKKKSRGQMVLLPLIRIYAIVQRR
jgi:hypothetical protein